MSDELLALLMITAMVGSVIYEIVRLWRRGFWR